MSAVSTQLLRKTTSFGLAHFWTQIQKSLKAAVLLTITFSLDVQEIEITINRLIRSVYIKSIRMRINYFRLPHTHLDLRLYFSHGSVR